MVKVNVFLADMDDFVKMNEVYMTYWGDVKPCRTWVLHQLLGINVLLTFLSCVAVKTLPHNTDVEIECTAVQNK